MTAIKFKDLPIGEKFRMSPYAADVEARRINTRESSLTTRGLVNAEDTTTQFVFFVNPERKVWRIDEIGQNA